MEEVSATTGMSGIYKKISQNHPIDIRMTSAFSNKSFQYNHWTFIVYLILSTSFLYIQMFQGISFLDIGMYMSGYEYFAEDPHPSVFLGQWLLSFLSSSYLLHLFPSPTYLNIRIIFLVLTVFLQGIIYLYVKKYIPAKYIIMGLALTTLSLYGAYTEINYNDYTLLLALLAIICYHRGTLSSPFYIAGAGAIIGLSFYFRITNLSFLALPILSGFIHKIIPYSKWSIQKEMGYFYTGWIAGMLLTYIGIYLFGYSEILNFTLLNIIQVGGNTNDSHNLVKIALCFYEIHKNEIAAISLIGCFTLFIYKVYQVKNNKLRRLIQMGLLLNIIICIYYWEEPSSITIGICLLGFWFCLKNNAIPMKVKHLYALSLCLPLLAPLGSNAGAAFACKGICIFSLPFALYSLAMWKGHLQQQEHYIQSIQMAGIAICLAMLCTNIKRSMMEDGNRLTCRYRINSPYTGEIRTTQENADLHNYLLKEVKPKLPKGSYLICNFSLTAVSLLDAKPYAVYSTVFSQDVMNEKYIRYAYSHTHRLPYILDSAQERNEKDSFVIDLLKSMGRYEIIWTDGNYSLFAPK